MYARGIKHGISKQIVIRIDVTFLSKQAHNAFFSVAFNIVNGVTANVAIHRVYPIPLPKQIGRYHTTHGKPG